MTQWTPISRVFFSDRNLLVKRDDLFPVAGGGNKGRKLHRIFRDDLPVDCQSIITNGGIQSNHTRVCALMAAELGLEAHLVLHGEQSALTAPEGNLLIALLAGAKVHIVKADNIGPTISQLQAGLTAKNQFPHVIPGGAHCVAGALAYADAIDELDVLPDVIVLPSGTGATHAGIMAGLDRRKANTRVYGVSVARRNPRGIDVVRASYLEARAALRLDAAPLREVLFDDRWVCGGYDMAGREIYQVIRRVARETGIILDPTYTGKAFLGMLGLMQENTIKEEESVMFWHTGGLLNALASTELKDMVR